MQTAIKKIPSDRKRFLSLLLLADEQEIMINKYNGRGDMFVMYTQDGIGTCSAIVTDEGDGMRTISFYRKCGFNYSHIVPDFFTVNYDHRIQSMIYTTNWIERLQKDFRRVARMRGVMPNEESVILLMGKTAIGKKSYLGQVPRIDLDRTLFLV